MRNFNEKYSLVRFLHAVPGEGTVDVYLNKDPFFYNMRFTKFSPYVYVPEGKYLLQIFKRDEKSKPIFENEIIIEGGHLLTTAFAGDDKNSDILVIEEDTEAPESIESKVRFVNLIPNSIDVNVYLDGEIFVEESDFQDISDYKLVVPKTYRLEVELTENKQLIRKLRITINQSRIYTLYAIGNKPNFQIFQSLDGATFLS